MLSEEAFHIKISSWVRITGEVWEGKHIYLFGGMVPQPLPRETSLALRKCLDKETLTPAIKEPETCMQSLHVTLENIRALVSPFPTFYEFFCSNPLVSLTCFHVVVSIPSVGPHSHSKPTFLGIGPLTTKPPPVPRKKIKTTFT